MDSLLENRRYELSNNEDKTLNKTVLLVKLTDSGLKSIQECFKHPGCFKPSIQFGEHNGVMNIPAGNGIKQYNFILQGIEGKENESNNFPNKSFECVQQKRNGSLESVGYVAAKMQIQAKDDIYENTRCKITAADKEQKQFGTKVIKQTASHLGQQVKVNQPKNIAISSSSCCVPVIKSIGPMKKKYNTEHSFNSTPVSSVRCDSNSSTKPVSILSNSPGSNFPKKGISSPKALSGIQRQPIRDRIIHLLALKSYKKVEIVQRIKKEGVNEKHNLSVILRQVSTLKKNCYNLSDGLWGEVRDNWKFYSPEEAEIVRKRKQEYFQRRYSSNIQSSSSTKEHLQNESTTSLYPFGTKRRISHLNGTSSQKHKQDGHPKNEVKSPSFFRAECSQTYQISCGAIIDMPDKDHESNAINQVSQPIDLFSPEYGKKNIDLNSPSTQSSGYKSMSSSQRSDESFVNTTKKSKPKYLPVLNLCDRLLEKNVTCQELARGENSGLSSVVPPSKLGSNKKKSATLPSGQERKMFKGKHQIFAKGENEIVNRPSHSGMPSHPGLAGDSSAVQVSNTEYERKGDLKLVVKHIGKENYKIKDKKAARPSKETFHPTHKKDRQISSGESSKQVKISDGSAEMSIVNSSMTNKQPEVNLGSPCLTEPYLFPSNPDVSGHQAPGWLTPIQSITNEEVIEALWKFGDFKKQLVKIESEEQRKQYDAIFDAGARKYDPILAEVIKFQQNFAALNKKFNETPRGTEEFQKIERAIVEENEAAKANGYYEKRQKMIFVFEKMSYIKKLLHEYKMEKLEKH